MANTSAINPSFQRALLHSLKRNWWMLLLRGICAIVFGLLTFAWPGLSLVTLVLLYGAFAFIDGVFALVAAISGGASGPRWWLALVGLLGIAAGLAAWFWPGLTALVLLYLIAGWAIAIGIMQIIGAIQLRKEIDNEWALIAIGVIAVLFGIAMFLQPGAGAVALALVIGGFACAYGILLVWLALRLRRHTHVAA